MGTPTYLILSILCAGLQHEILASSPGGASSSESKPAAYVVKGSPTPEFAQGIRFLYMDNPTRVNIVLPDADGHYTRVTGPGLAVHPNFVATRSQYVQKGCKIASYRGNKIKYFNIDSEEASPKDNVVLLYTDDLILLDNGYRLQDGFIKYKYGQREYDWVKFKVNKWIAKFTLPERRYRGNED